jgi:hypothetical protein
LQYGLYITESHFKVFLSVIYVSTRYPSEDLCVGFFVLRGGRQGIGVSCCNVLRFFRVRSVSVVTLVCVVRGRQLRLHVNKILGAYAGGATVTSLTTLKHPLSVSNSDIYDHAPRVWTEAQAVRHCNTIGIVPS